MTDCDIPKADLTTTLTTSSVNSENASSESKKRKTHRLKQRFQVVRKLGQGTYGKVQLAINNETGQEVAIKTIKKSKVSNQQDLIRIRREIQIMSSINHPNIIHIFEVFENKDKIVLVMQYASGGELYDYVSYNKVLSDTEARRVFRQIATAIYYCHKNKICHRDLKLENILLDEKGNAKIADFGLSNVFDDKHFLQTFCGSPLYASPEIVRGLPYFGPEVDCWSLGVLLYTLVYGAMPFDGSNFKKLVKQISEANYFEPTEKSGASNLIHKLLTPDPKERASIIDICTDEWVNQDSEHLLLQVADDLSNLTKHAVRLDMLLALAPGTPTEQKTNNLTEPQSNEKIEGFNKRVHEMPLTNDSLAELAGKKTGKKKSKKSTSNDQVTILTGQNNGGEQDLGKNQPKSEQISSDIEPTVNEKEQVKNVDNGHAKYDSMTNINENQIKSEGKSNESSTSSIAKRRGKLSIPDIWNPNKDMELSSPIKERKEPILSGYFSVSELKKGLEEKAAGSKMDKRRGTLADTSELKLATKAENVKKYQNRSLSLNLIENVLPEANAKLNDNKKMDIDSVKGKRENVENSIEFKGHKEVEDKAITAQASGISVGDNEKSLAKQIIQKNITKAKMMEKSQTSIDSGETTPLISIENSTISVLQNSPASASTAASSTSNVFFKRVLENEQNTRITNNVDRKELNETQPIHLPVNSTPISRSYKKVIFTKDGAKITETGKFYSHEGDNGVTTRVETTSRVTHMINNGQGSMNIQRSDSQSSTGSVDIFEDIFDDHWTGDNLFSNVKSLFSDFFGCSTEKLSLKSRAESLERTNWFPERSNDNKNSRLRFLNENITNSNVFGSQKSLFASKSIFSDSSFSKSNFGKEFNFDDLMSSACSRIDTYKKYGLINNQISRNNERDFFQPSHLLGEIDTESELESNKNRIEQWLDNNDDDDAKNFDQCMNTYGTIRPRNAVRRYSRTMTSNDYKSDIFKKVQISNSSSCQVIKQKTSTIRTENVIPRNSDVHINFSLDDSLGKLIISQSGLSLNDSKKSSITNANDNLSDLKIEEPSSLLEQLRTFGYKKMVNRRLSDSSSTEDLLQVGTTSSLATTSTTTTESTSTVSNKSSAINEEIAEKVERNVLETMKMFHNDKEWQLINDYRCRTMNAQDYINTETVEERIHRKSYYSRFNDTLDTCRQRRRSATRTNEYCYGSNFLPRSTSSSSTTIERHFFRPKFNNSFDSKRCLYTSSNKKKSNLTFDENPINSDRH